MVGRFPIKFRLISLMVAVAVAAVIVWAVVEIGIRQPERQHARKLISHHQIQSGSWLFLAEATRVDPARREECLRFSAWHEKRINELQDGKVPSDPSWWEEGDRMTQREQDLFHQIGATGMAPVKYRGL